MHNVMNDKRKHLQPTITTTPNEMIVLGNNYQQAFGVLGGATITADVATLTKNTSQQLGATFLHHKLDMRANFILSGKVNLGKHSQKDGGGAGLTFMFHPSNVDAIGESTTSLGLGGIKGAFGFKLDTFYDREAEDTLAIDPIRFGHQAGHGVSFGAFVDGTNGVAQTISASAQQIAEPTENEFKYITLAYNGRNKIMTVTYDNQMWTQHVQAFLPTNHGVTFAITAATTSQHNTHQFQLEQLTYKIAPSQIISHYLDQSGHVLVPQRINQGQLNTSWQTQAQTIPNYTLMQTNGPTQGRYTVNDQHVNYIYAPNNGQILVKYQDDTTGRVLVVKYLNGIEGSRPHYQTAATIGVYEAIGFQLVQDEYPIKGVKFVTGQTRIFTVHFNHQTQAISPANAKIPGSPINRLRPLGPVWPPEAALDALTQVRLQRNDGHGQLVHYQRTIVIDRVTGTILGYDTDNDGKSDTTVACASWYRINK